MSATEENGFIEFALAQGVLKFGAFELKSGRTSPYFFNAGLFRDGAALSRLGGYYAEKLMAAKVEMDVLFGPLTRASRWFRPRPLRWQEIMTKPCRMPMPGKKLKTMVRAARWWALI